MKNNTNYREGIISLFAWLALIAVFICDIIFLAQNVRFHTNSDLASEMILARLLHDEHKWITTSWFYSTELWVVAVAPIYSIGFIFSDDWQTVRIIGAVLTYSLLAFGAIYVCSSFGQKSKRISPLCAAVVLLPLSDEWRQTILAGMYYAPQVALSFISLGLLFRNIDERDKRKKLISLMIQGIIAFLSGLGGLRMITLLYCPLFLLGILKYKVNKNVFINTFVCMISAGFGYVINLILELTGTINYSTFLRTKPALPSFVQIKELILDLGRNLGFTTEITGISSIFGMTIAVLFWIIFLYCVFKLTSGYKREGNNILQLFIGYLVISFSVFVMIYMFTNMDYYPRYNIHLIGFVVLLTFVIISESRFSNISICILLFAIIACFTRYVEYSIPGSEYKKYSEIVEYVESGNLSRGYASFWNANMTTDVSDGTVEMWALEGDINKYYNRTLHDGLVFPFDGEDVVIGQWLQLTEHERILPEYPVFVIVSDEEYENDIIDKEYYDKHFVMQSDNLRLYVFNE